MKVVKTAVFRLSVDMSCGCKMYAEFKDSQCKEPMHVIGDETDATFEKTFLACAKHATDASVSMLEFIIGERLDEAVQEAQKQPVRLHGIPNSQAIEDGDSGGVMAVGEKVQAVARVNKPAAVRNRQAPPVKQVQRSAEQLARAGAAPIGKTAAAPQAGDMVDLQMSAEAPEDPNITPHIFEALDFLDTRESGLLDESEIDPNEI